MPATKAHFLWEEFNSCVNFLYPNIDNDALPVECG